MMRTNIRNGLAITKQLMPRVTRRLNPRQFTLGVGPPPNNRRLSQSPAWVGLC